MGCRPSKQATSKVRAVEHKDDPKCLCSPKKVRKTNHKCSGNDNTSGRRASAGSKSESKKQSFSVGPRPRSAKSADLDFPAFSTTTAVYRKSASKTSKITLRLSCDGSTLEIEQCDYDLEKAHAEAESKPRPWSSAPNLTKLRDSKARLFRESNLPMKHSASAWSPSVVSTASGSRGGQIRVPVQVNTPEERGTSATNFSGHHLSNASADGSNSPLEQNGNTAVAKDFRHYSSKSITKPSMPKQRSSSSFGREDEREPLLQSRDRDGSSKKIFIENNTNKAFDFNSSCSKQTEEQPSCGVLDSMIDDLEYSLELTHHMTYSSGPVIRRPRSLEVNQEHIQEDSKCHQEQISTSNLLTHTSSEESYNTGISPDFEQIPVNLISSYINAVPPHPTVTGSQVNNNQKLTATSSDAYYFVNQPQGTHLASGSDSHGHITASSIHTQRHITQSLTNGCTDSKLDRLGGTKQKSSSDVARDIPTSERTAAKLHEIPDRGSRVSQLSPPLSSPIDCDSVLTFVALGCPVPNEMPSFMYASEDESPLSLFTPQHHVIYPYQESYTDEGQHCLSQSIPDLHRDGEYELTSDECDLCRSSGVSGYCDKDSPLDIENITQFVIDSSDSESGYQAKKALYTSATVSRSHENESSYTLQQTQKAVKAISEPQVKKGGCTRYNGELSSTGDESLMEIMADTVEENYISSHNREEDREKDQSGDADENVLSNSGSSSRSSLLKGTQTGAMATLDTEPSSREETSESSPDAETEVYSGSDEETERTLTGSSDNDYDLGVQSISGTNSTMMIDNCARTGSYSVGSYINKGGVQCLSQGLSYDNGSAKIINEKASVKQHEEDTDENFDDMKIFSQHVQEKVGNADSGNAILSHQDNTKNEIEFITENADYLVDLLYQDGQSTSTDSAKLQFSSDFDDSDGKAFCVASFSDASDTEGNSIYLALSNQLHRTSENKHVQLMHETDTEEGRSVLASSLREVKKTIIRKNLATSVSSTFEPDTFAKLNVAEKKGCSYIFGVEENSGGNRLTMPSFPTSLKGLQVPSIGEDGSPLADESRLGGRTEVENTITHRSHREESKMVGEKEDNEGENMAATILLRADILTQNISDTESEVRQNLLDISRSGGETPARDVSDTGVDGCKNRSHSLSSPWPADVNTFSKEHTFWGNALPSENPSAARLSPSSQTNRQIQVDSEGGQVLIEALTSGRRRPGENSEGHQNECLIDPPDRSHLNPDENPGTDLTPVRHMNGTPAIAMKKEISLHSTNSIIGTDISGSLNEICLIPNGSVSDKNKSAHAESSLTNSRNSNIRHNIVGQISRGKNQDPESSENVMQLASSVNHRQPLSLDNSVTRGHDCGLTFQPSSESETRLDGRREGQENTEISDNFASQTLIPGPIIRKKEDRIKEQTTVSSYEANGVDETELTAGPGGLLDVLKNHSLPSENGEILLSHNKNSSLQSVVDGEVTYLGDNEYEALVESEMPISSNVSRTLGLFNTEPFQHGFRDNEMDSGDYKIRDNVERVSADPDSPKETHSFIRNSTSDLKCESSSSSESCKHFSEDQDDHLNAPGSPITSCDTGLQGSLPTNDLTSSQHDVSFPTASCNHHSIHTSSLNKKHSLIDSASSDRTNKTGFDKNSEKERRAKRKKNNVLSLVRYFETVPYGGTDPQ